MSCVCDAALEAAKSETVRTRRFSHATAQQIMAGSDALSSSREQVHYRCRACKRDWFYLEWDMGGVQFNYLSTDPEIPPPPCSCAAVLAARRWAEPLPSGVEEQKVIDHSDVVSAEDGARRLRCRSCRREWTQRRYDQGHVFFDFLEPG